MIHRATAALRANKMAMTTLYSVLKARHVSLGTMGGGRIGERGGSYERVKNAPFHRSRLRAGGASASLAEARGRTTPSGGGSTPRVLAVFPAVSAVNDFLGSSEVPRGLAVQSCKTTLSREVLTLRPPLYSMNPNFLNLFMKKFTRERVVPTISASTS